MCKYNQNNALVLSCCAWIFLGFYLPVTAQSPVTSSTNPSSKPALSFLSDTTRYIWPTDASQYMSSTFGETRAAHFHAALDIKTWGRKGYKVFATRDGILHRVATGPNGYGNVIYLKHRDGSYSVYAHLQRFIPEITTLVDSLRLQNYSFVFDKNMESYNIHFEQGDVIGYTGASGVGPPHLHFELRSPNYKPFNPLLTNIEIPDNRPSRFSGLSVEPLSKNATIEGEHRIITLKPAWRNGVYDFGTIDVTGTVGLGVDAFDQANDVANVYAAYELKLESEDKVWFHSRIDSFSYDNTHQMFIDRVYPILKKTRKGYQRLFVADGNTLSFYQTTYNRGRLNLPEGKHKFTVTATDYYGNSRKAVVRLDVFKADETIHQQHRWSYISPHELLDLTYPKNSNLKWTDDWLYVTNITEISYRPLAAATSEFVTKGENGHNSISLETAQPGLIQPKEGETFLMHRVLPGSSSRLYTPDQRMELHIPENSVYDTLSLGIDYEVQQDSVRLDIFPHTQPLKNDMNLTLLLDTTVISFKRPIVYWHNERKDSFYAQETSFTGNTITAKIESFGTHYIVDDAVKPDISNPRLYRREDGHWIVSVRTNDELSGIDYERSEFYCNNSRGIAEYNPEQDRLMYYHPDFRPEQLNNCEIIVYDVAGNKAKALYEIPK